MSQFTKPLKVQFIDGSHWVLLAPFVYFVGYEGSDELIFVTAGFKTDFASIPRFAWPIIGHPTGKYGKAAVIHDWLYEFPSDGVEEQRSRRRCDQIFLEGLKVLGVGWWKRSTMYSAVRVGGWVGWNADRGRE